MGHLRVSFALTLVALTGAAPALATGLPEQSFEIVRLVSAAPNEIVLEVAAPQATDLQIRIGSRSRSRSQLANTTHVTDPLQATTQQFQRGTRTIRVPVDAPLDAGVYPVEVRSSDDSELTWAVVEEDSPSPLRVVLVPSVYPPPQWSVNESLDPRLIGFIEQIPPAALATSVALVSPLLVRELEQAGAGKALDRLALIDTVVRAPLPDVPANDPRYAQALEQGSGVLAQLGALSDIRWSSAFFGDPPRGRYLTSGSNLARRGMITQLDPVESNGSVFHGYDAEVSALGPTSVARTVAEIAMIHFEAPSRDRTATIVLDALTPTFAPVYSRLAESRIIELVQDWPEPVPGTIKTQSSALSSERVDLSGFRSWVHPSNPLLAQLRLVAAAVESDSWWLNNPAGRDQRIESINSAIELAKSRLSLDVPDPVTFTSSDGAVPVTVRNGNPWPVRVRVAIRSGAVEPGVVEAEIPEGGDTVSITTKTRGSGTSPLEVLLLAGDDDTQLASTVIAVKSTALSRVAVGVVVAAGLFFLFTRRRR